MNADPTPHPTAAPAALAAFLRGVERRGAVLAELQCGDPTSADLALGAAMRRFRVAADELGMPEWPRAFWAGLIAQPELQRRVPVALPLEVTDTLGSLGHGPRAAALLHLAAGLSEETAAAALGISLTSYRLALHRAMPQGEGGRVDPAGWQRLREHIQHRIKHLPPERLDRLAELRDQALGRTGPRLRPVEGGKTPPSERGGAAEPGPRPRWVMAALWAVLLLSALAFAATWYPPVVAWLAQPGESLVRYEALPASEPAARFGADAAAITHPDFALLADPAGEAAARQLDFHSWLAAGAPAPPGVEADAEAAPVPAAVGSALPVPRTPLAASAPGTAGLGEPKQPGAR